MSKSTSRYHIESLGRGLQILEAFTKETPQLTLTEISQAVGLDKSTVFRFAYTLEQLGYLVRDPETKRYHPGIKVLRLGFGALGSFDIAQVAGPYLRALLDESGETTNLAVRDGGDIVYVVRNRTKKIISINLHIGSRLPVHCTSMGKALVLDMSRDELLSLLGEGPYPAMTPNTLTGLDDLVANLSQAREQGYAINDEELAIGLRSVAAPIRDYRDQIIASVNISVPSARVSLEQLHTVLAPMLVSTAWQISRALGTGHV